MKKRPCRFRSAAWRGGAWSLAVFVILFAAAPWLQAQTEDGIKAAFVYNFAKFTEWPAGAFADGSAPIIVGFVGAASLADIFEKNVVGKNANGRDFVIKKLSDAAGVEKCQIVYVTSSSQVGAVVAALKSKPVLIVGEGEEILSTGGSIRLFKDGTKIAFDLNLTAIAAVGLKVDPKLQKTAHSVKGP